MNANTLRTEEILATVKGLRARSRKMPKYAKSMAHFQMAKRAISNAVLFAEKNAAYATESLWTARFHLNAIGVD